jgi:hypothetical protein
MYYVATRLIDSIFMGLWKIAECMMVCMFPMVLPANQHVIEIDFLEIHGQSRFIPDTIYEEIDNIDYTFQTREPVQNTYYIGSYVYLPGRIVLGSVISAHAFFLYTHIELHHYLVGFHLSPNPEQAVHVLQLTGEPGESVLLGQVYFYNLPIIVKTYWIRIIQRTWARVCREKMRVIAIRKLLGARRTFEETGQYPEGARHLPSIRGMLSVYNT